MPSEGPLGPSVGANVANASGASWVNPSNITAEDESTARITGTAGESDYLVARDFGFDIPAGATINGLQVDILRWSQVDGEVKDAVVSVWDQSGPSVIGLNMAREDPWDSSTVYVSYGNATHKWGVFPLLGVEFVNSSDFGIALVADLLTSDAIAYVDAVRATVYYTEGGSGSQTRIALTGVGR